MKQTTYLFVISLIISLVFIPSSVLSSDWHGKRASRIAGNIYVGNVGASCVTGFESTESSKVTYNFDGTSTYTSEGITRVQASPDSPAKVLATYSIECKPGAFSIERFKHGVIIKNTEPTQCSLTFLTDGPNFSAGDVLSYSNQVETQISKCNGSLTSCEYADLSLAERTEIFTVASTGETFELPNNICSVSGSYTLIGRKHRKDKQW